MSSGLDLDLLDGIVVEGNELRTYCGVGDVDSVVLEGIPPDR